MGEFDDAPRPGVGSGTTQLGRHHICSDVVPELRQYIGDMVVPRLDLVEEVPDEVEEAGEILMYREGILL